MPTLEFPNVNVCCCIKAEIDHCPLPFEFGEVTLSQSTNPKIGRGIRALEVHRDAYHIERNELPSLVHNLPLLLVAVVVVVVEVRLIARDSVLLVRDELS
jgi:hypothetical protein